MNPWEVSGLALGTAALPAAIWAWRVLVRRRFATLASGSLYRSAEMSPSKIESTVQRLGIRTVVDLRSPGEGIKGEIDTLSRLGVVHLHLPASQLPRDAEVDAFLRAVARVERPVLIHCCHGAGRSRLFAAIFLVEFEGWSLEQAARTLPFRSGKARRAIASYRRRGAF